MTLPEQPPPVPARGEQRAVLVWEGPQSTFHSLARCNSSVCNAMLDRDLVDLRIVSNEKHRPEPNARPDLARLRTADVGVAGLPVREAAAGRALWVRHQWPPRTTSPGRFPWVVLQPWEYSLLPSALVEIFNRCREVWAPSSFCAEAFRRSGVTTDVAIVPYGVDTACFRPGGERAALDGARGFRFLFVGASIHRKGVDVLMSAFLRTFHRNDDVTLVIKDVGAGSVYDGQTASARIRAVAADASSPHVLYIDETLTDRALADLYRSCDAFVAAYRGEGFSLPTLEAMACGLPVLVTDGGATDDFVDDAVGWRVPATLRSVGRSIYGQATPGEAFLLEPDAEALASQMREAFEHRAETRRRGAAASERARARWTWHDAADRVLDRATALLAAGSGTATKPPSG